MNIICYDTLPLQKTELYRVRACPLAHSPLETSLKAPAHFHYFKYGESQMHIPACVCTPTLSCTRLFICKHCRYVRIMLREASGPLALQGGRAPPGSLVERKVGVGNK